ncbi:MAG: rhodanese-like domain-containing protein [Defluviitaleaceae bacterium]|nr:rhodanese-like domain-containing protein [Defluviitaleaceae bacterium]
MKNHFKLIIVGLTFILLVAAFSACGSRTVIAPEYIKLTPQEAQDLLAEHVLILDVRTRDEFEQYYIANAVHLPVDDIKDFAEHVLTDKNQVIFVYCRAGNRSRTAAMALIDIGYTCVYDIGGIYDWLGELSFTIGGG